ncbi:hypothetical protein G6011_07064 [Alternaria panax]|uniref:Xaa-Pro dipeptidyl-peptidase C-terminal domain-containing protein n=1 Tax=Alternaria panax TaxID=48097 RepID=A0AAD4FBH6_9PLEO|nr:hypothetical protein G6011_07064 [Alternaria panax]
MGSPWLCDRQRQFTRLEQLFGNIHFWGKQEGQDSSDAIEELAKLPWCSDKLALTGNSWLAISQHFIAAEQHPHLACITPLEGLSDPTREETLRGGIPNTEFSESIAIIISGRNKRLEEKVLEYQADSSDEVSFTYTFPAKTVLTGPSNLVIDIAAPDHDDIDIHAHVFKADASGALLSHLNMPVPLNTPASTVETMAQNRIWRYFDPSGMLRALERHLHSALLGKTWATVSHEHDEKIKSGELIRLRIQLWPTGIVFEAGKQLVLKISGKEMGLRAFPKSSEPSNSNKGKRVLHIGGLSESYLEVVTI